MGQTCKVCGGTGKFEIAAAKWSEPKPNPPYYEVTTQFYELPCKCCDGRGGNCGCQ